MASLYGFKPNLKGISAVMKSEGMQAALQGAVSPIADRANASYGLAPGERVPLKVPNGTVQMVKVTEQPKADPYGWYVDLGTYTAIGKVVCMTYLGRYDNAINNTILKSR